MNYLNLLKPLEYALHEGRDGVTGIFSGMQSPPLAAYTTFDDLLQEYKRQLLRLIDLTVETVNGFEGYLAHINPQSMLSATIPSCLERGKDALAGGAVRNDSTLQFGFLADAADSLMMIRKYVYERQELTLAELVDMLDADFAENCTDLISGNGITIIGDAGETLPVTSVLGVLSSTSTDNSTYTVIDGELVELIDRYLTYSFESVTVIYTKAEFESTVTGVEDINVATTKRGQRYNLMGQPVAGDYKGIVIENGKKRVIK
jgi:hypothetical protein